MKNKFEIKEPIVLNTKYPIAFIGDTHGSWSAVAKFVREKNYRGTLIQCGDAGVGFRGWENNLQSLNMLLGEKGTTLYIVRGNHDNPFYFNLEHEFSHIKLLSDYRLFKINDEYLLTLGGGISLDRQPRINQDRTNAQFWAAGIVKEIYETYWVDEPVIYKKELITELFSKYNIKYIATHSVGINCPPVGIDAEIVRYYCSFDKQLKNDILKERNDLNEMFNQIKSITQIKEWIYGHFHSSSTTFIDNVKFVLLDCDEIYELKF